MLFLLGDSAGRGDIWKVCETVLEMELFVSGHRPVSWHCVFWSGPDSQWCAGILQCADPGMECPVERWNSTFRKWSDDRRGIRSVCILSDDVSVYRFLVSCQETCLHPRDDTDFFCILPEIILRYSSSLGSMMLLTCAAGTWLLFYQAGSRIRRLQWLAALGAILTLIASLSGRRQVPAMLELQEKSIQTMDHIRYGEDLLPEGDLEKAWQMQNGDADTLLVSTEQVKPLYFRGFTGAEYENGRWRTLPKAAYGMERWGFLDWLKKNSFDVNAQYAAYETAGDTGRHEPDSDDIPENHIEVNNKGASRKYIYTVYSGLPLSGNQIQPERDNGYRSAALFGNWVYQYSEKSADLPGELTQLDDWAYQPQTEAQMRYLQGENVYRDFVYGHYLDIPEKLESEVFQLFHDGKTSDSVQEENTLSKEEIYGVTQDIRAAMETHLYYRQMPEPVGLKDPLLAFLQGQSYGNSAYYASAAVLALRSYGIPARYAEGYYLSRETIEANRNGHVQLTQKDAHAWAEVYMDGIGWIPVDFTPGFYYNTYALLRMAELPQNIRKTAALEEQGDEAENVTGNTPQSGLKEKNQLTEKIQSDLIWGIVLTLLFGAEVMLTILEVSRWRYDQRIQEPFGVTPQQETAFLVHAVAQNLRICGIEVRPGWKTAETEQQIRARFPDIPQGFYLRVNEILEKHIYGNAVLKPHELRLLQKFLTALRSGRKKLDLKQRIAFRYIGFRNGKSVLHYYDQP